jgi:chromate transporter
VRWLFHSGAPLPDADTAVAAAPDQAQPAAPAARVTLPALFVACLKISLYGIGGGGGLVWARRIAVEQQRWISDHDFADILGLCQFMPGPNIVGISTCIGTKLRGWTGAIAAVAGFLLIPWVIGFSLGVLFLQYAHRPVLHNILGGVSATAAGLLIVTGLKLLAPHRRRPAALVFAALAFGLITFGKLPLLVVLFGLTPLGIAVAWLETARAR